MLSYESENGRVRVCLFGEVDHHTAAGLRREIDEVVRRERPQVLEMDFSSVDFCDSSGIALVLGRYKQMTALGGRVVVSGLCSSIRHIFDLADLKKIVTIEPEKAGGEQ